MGAVFESKDLSRKPRKKVIHDSIKDIDPEAKDTPEDNWIINSYWLFTPVLSDNICMYMFMCHSTKSNHIYFYQVLNLTVEQPMNVKYCRHNEWGILGGVYR